jgi:hypothetical protein
MREIHVECLPDEALVKRLGMTAKFFTHHTGKSRMFFKLKYTSGVLAMVDEDPGSAKTSYERQLLFVTHQHGISFYKDGADNKIVVLKVKLEDWVISICKLAKVDVTKFNLPNRPNELHEVINQRLRNFERLIDYLLSINNPAIITLQNWLVEK